MKRASLLLPLALVLGLPNHAADAQTLKAVRDRGFLSCGVSPGSPEFSSPDDKGNWTGLDVDICRAVAAAVLDDPSKVLFVLSPAKDRAAALQSGEIDMLSRSSTWTLVRDASLDLNYAGITYYDGQGFMVRKSARIHSPLEFDAASVCVQSGTVTGKNAADYFTANDLKYELIAFRTADEALKAYEAGRCDTYTAGVPQLLSDRLELANPGEHVVLRKIVSKESSGPAVRHGDDQWFDIVKWTLFAMLNAEELGVTQENVDRMSGSDKPEVRRMLGTDGNPGEHLGLARDWVVRVVRAVGNYGESLDRNLGAESRLGAARGLNRPWIHGGLQ